MARRFFSEALIDGTHAVLADTEAHHLKHVLRAKLGDHVELFDGSGAEFTAEVTALSRSDVELRIVERREICRESARRLTLAVSLPKGDRQKWLVEKCTELGVATLIPLVTQRGVAQPKDSAISRLRRAVIEASKQCGRNRLMQIAEPAPLASLEVTGPSWLAHPDGEMLLSQSSLEVPQTNSTQMTVAIGPEGGFTDEEVAAARAGGWRVASLGLRILRIETAAIAVAAVLLSQRG